MNSLHPSSFRLHPLLVINPLACRADAVLGLAVPRMQYVSTPTTIDPATAATLRPVKRRGAARRWIIAAFAVAVGLYWIVQTFRRGMFTADPSGVTMVTNTAPGKGENDVLPNAFISAYLNPGHSIDRGTLDGHSARLYRTGDHMPVAAQVSTSAACDDIVLTPMQMLE